MAVDCFQWHSFIAFKYSDIAVCLRDQVSRVGYHFDCVDVHPLHIFECYHERLLLDFDPTSVVFAILMLVLTHWMSILSCVCSSSVCIYVYICIYHWREGICWKSPFWVSFEKIKPPQHKLNLFCFIYSMNFVKKLYFYVFSHSLDIHSASQGDFLFPKRCDK